MNAREAQMLHVLEDLLKLINETVCFENGRTEIMLKAEKMVLKMRKKYDEDARGWK